MNELSFALGLPHAGVMLIQKKHTQNDWPKLTYVGIVQILGTALKRQGEGILTENAQLTYHGVFLYMVLMHASNMAVRCDDT